MIVNNFDASNRNINDDDAAQWYRKELLAPPIAGFGYRELSFRWVRYIFYIALIAFFGYVIGVAGISAYVGRMVIRPTIKDIPPINVNIPVDYSSVNFKSFDNSTTLRGWLFKAPNAENIVIMVHDTGENRFQFGTDTLDIVRLFVDHDFSVLTFDLRNSGDSTAGISTFGLFEADDVLGAMAYAINSRYTNIVLYGFGAGANAIMLASAKPTLEKAANSAVTQQLFDTINNSVSAMILDTPITDIRGYIMKQLEEHEFILPDFPFRYVVPLAVNLFINGDIFVVDDVDAFNSFIPRPVLILRGGLDDMDNTAEFDRIEDMYNTYHSAAPGKISMWNDVESGYLESYVNSKETYLEIISNFLDATFHAAP